MPIGPYENFGECVADQKKKGKSADSAKKICGSIKHKSEGKKEKKYVHGLNLKEEQGTFFIEGFVSDPGYDLEGDRYLNQLDIVEQMNSKSESKKGSLHHDREGSALLLSEHAEMKLNPRTGEECAWIKTKMNKMHPDFGKTKYEVEEGYIDGFSIEFMPPEIVGVEGVDFVYNGREVGDHRGRDIYHAPILGYGLASRGIQPDASFTDFYTKEFIDMKKIDTKEENDNNKKKEGDLMSKKEETKTPEGEETSEETGGEAETKPEDSEKKEEKPEEKPEENSEKPEDGAKPEGKEKNNSLNIDVKEIKASLKELKEAKKPLNAPGNQMEKKEVPQEIIAYKQAINLNNNLSLKEFKESHADNLDRQYQAANALVNSIPDIYERGLKGVGSLPIDNKSWGVNRSFINYKALLTHDSPTNAEATYYQAAAELGDVYDPVIYSHMNDRTTTWGILPKIDMSASHQMIQFRANDTAGITAAGYNEGDTSWTATNWSLKKFEQEFAYYRSIIEVTDQTIISARAAGGIGDAFGESVKRATIELIKKLNTDILTGAGGTYDGTDSQYLLGFQHLVLDTGNLYGKSRSGIATLQGTDEAMSSAELSFTQMRKMKRTVLEFGASKENLVFITSYTLADKFRSLMQSYQRMVPTSSRIGFEGLPEIDGIPIFEDQLASDDDMFLIDLSVTRIGIQRPPTIIEFGRTGDTRKAAIVMYFNLYCTNPNHNYWSSGFATT